MLLLRILWPKIRESRQDAAPSHYQSQRRVYGMLIPKTLILENVGRFVGRHIIDFTKLNSLTQIEGQNNNTGGSSGAAKSTIFKALEFLLGLNDVPNGVLQSRLTKEPMCVTGVFDFNGQPLTIDRGKKLVIKLNDETTTGSNKLAEELLDRIIGMPRDLFRKILHKRQGEGGFFLDMGPSDTHKFLTDCLGLEKEQAKVITLDGVISKLIEFETSLKSVVESHKSALQATHSAIAGLGLPPTLEIDPEAVETLKTTYDEAVNTYKLVLDSHKNEINDLEKNGPQVISTPFDRSKIEGLELEIGTILSQSTALEDLEKQRCNTIRGKIPGLQAEISGLNSAEALRQSSFYSKINEVKSQIAVLEKTEVDRQKGIQSKISTNTIEKVKTVAVVNEGRTAKLKAQTLAFDLNKIRASLCPTCEQGWINDAAKTKESDILNKLQECKTLILTGMAAEKKLLDLEEEANKLKEEILPVKAVEISVLEETLNKYILDSQPQVPKGIQKLNEEIAQYKIDSEPKAVPEAIELKLKADFKNQELAVARQEERIHQTVQNQMMQISIAEHARKQTELRRKHQLEAQIAQDAANSLYGKLQAAQNQIKSFDENTKRFNESVDRLTVQLLGYSEQLETKAKELAKVGEEIELATEAKKAIKSYLSCSFEDALEGIGDTATRFIRAIPNMANATIQFEGLKETKEGKIKEEVNCVISMDGEIGIPVKSLSGGERSSTDLAIDLAAIKFIEERTGKGCSLFVLDEPFTGLDSQNILEALEMLKECSVDKQLLIVDHNPMTSQSIENRLTVIRDGLTSKVVQQ